MRRLIFHPISALSKTMSRRHLYERLNSEVQGKALNIGAAGPIPDLLKTRKDIELTNIDINPTKKPDIVCDACDMTNIFQNEIFDTVVIMEVLEHIPEPGRAISEIKRVLKPGGKIILSTPFIFPIHAEPHDYWRFTHYGVKLLLKDFINVRVFARGQYAQSIIVMIARLSHGEGNKRLLGLFFVPLAVILWPFALLFDGIFSDHRATTGYFATAVKAFPSGTLS